MFMPLTDVERSAEIAHLQHQLKVKQAEIMSLLEITEAINSNLSSSGLMSIFESTVTKRIGIRRVAVFLPAETGWTCAVSSGVDEQILAKNIPAEFHQFRYLTKLSRSDGWLKESFDIVMPVFHKEKPLAFALLGNIPEQDDAILEEKLNYIQTIFNIIAVAIENKRLFRLQTAQDSLKRELELAGQMQTMLIPSQLPSDERLQIAAVYLPHLDVGGDYYDFFHINENEVAFCVGDISGQGIAAALLMANFQASLRALIHLNPTPENLIRQINTRVMEITRGEKFITLFFARFNFKTRELQYVNAGHNPPVLMANNKIQLLEDGCTILGMFENLPYVHSGAVTLPVNSFLFCYTDGLIEVENENGEQLEATRLIEFLKLNNTKQMEEINNDLLDYLVEFKQKNIFKDDITIFSCRIF